MRYQILVVPNGQAAIRDKKTGKIVSRHPDKEDAENEMSRIIEDNQWHASNRD